MPIFFAVSAGVMLCLVCGGVLFWWVLFFWGMDLVFGLFLVFSFD
jgi:hypothetical protein